GRARGGRANGRACPPVCCRAPRRGTEVVVVTAQRGATAGVSAAAGRGAAGGTGKTAGPGGGTARWLLPLPVGRARALRSHGVRRVRPGRTVVPFRAGVSGRAGTGPAGGSRGELVSGPRVPRAQHVGCAGSGLRAAVAAALSAPGGDDRGAAGMGGAVGCRPA